MRRIVVVFSCAMQVISISFFVILGAAEPKCNPETQFDCGDGKICISIAQVCDYKNDCGAWQDEPRDSCGVNECLTGNGGTGNGDSLAMVVVISRVGHCLLWTPIKYQYQFLPFRFCQ